MSEEDLELLVTLDDPGEDTLEQDTFHQAANAVEHGPFNLNKGGDASNKQK